MPRLAASSARSSRHCRMNCAPRWTGLSAVMPHQCTPGRPGAIWNDGGICALARKPGRGSQEGNCKMKYISSIPVFSPVSLGFFTLLLVSPAVRAQDALSPPRMAPPPSDSAAPAAPAAPAPPEAKDTTAYSGLINSPLRFGLGLNVGNLVTGVTAKLWASSAVAFQTALGEGPDGNNIRWLASRRPIRGHPRVPTSEPSTPRTCPRTSSTSIRANGTPVGPPWFTSFP